jgi:hypothetical protein
MEDINKAQSTTWIKTKYLDFELMFSSCGLKSVNLYEPNSCSKENFLILEQPLTELFFQKKLPLDIQGTDFQKKSLG